MKPLDKRHCEPPEGSTPLSDSEEEKLIQDVHHWALVRNGTHHIERNFKFDGFDQAMDFVNKVANLASEENHHPDLCISYNKVDISLSTHKINGLHPNDFIMAAKINALN